ncbi:GTP cyclohydrolase I FolE [Microbulbifer sp. GL-2]|uniref:GTP cyclohydrolase I FolE n=1 Tax=Microbulbifer sp. GL-2 TaxID=2591606 RepID=UPI0011804913|nr:GTP cyclohydrolase I FolE [Microbulbifer sp. GL-2]
MKEHYARIIEEIGEDPQRPGLKSTPRRAAKAMKYLTSGYDQTVEDVVNNAIFPFDSSEMVLVKDIELYSLCEHHLLPFIGYSHVAYIPNGKILGISKLARIVDMFARRLQIQERLTTQIAETLQGIIGATGVGVVIEAKHTCMMMRGPQKQNSMMRTLAMLGTFRSNQATRNEFFSLLRQ